MACLFLAGVFSEQLVKRESLFLCRMVVLQQHAVALGGSVPRAAPDLQDPQMLTRLLTTEPFGV